MRAGTMTAAATYPTSAAEPPIARTANGIATSATAVPVTEMALQASSSRKLRLRNGPGRTFMSRSLTSGTAGGPPFTGGVAAAPGQPQAVTRGWAEDGAGRAARAVVPLPGGAGLTFMVPRATLSLKHSFQWRKEHRAGVRTRADAVRRLAIAVGIGTVFLANVDASAFTLAVPLLHRAFP